MVDDVIRLTPHQLAVVEALVAVPNRVLARAGAGRGYVVRDRNNDIAVRSKRIHAEAVRYLRHQGLINYDANRSGFPIAAAEPTPLAIEIYGLEAKTDA